MVFFGRANARAVVNRLISLESASPDMFDLICVQVRVVLDDVLQNGELLCLQVDTPLHIFRQLFVLLCNLGSIQLLERYVMLD